MVNSFQHFKKSMPTVMVGLDPSFRKSGFAAAYIDTTDKSIRFQKFKNGLTDFMSWVFNDSPEMCWCTVENSNLKKAVFRLYQTTSGKFITYSEAKRTRGAKAVNIHQAANAGVKVGKNQATSQDVFVICQAKWGSPFVEQLAPGVLTTKMNDRTFKGLIRSEGLTMYNYKGSEDERDAGVYALHSLRNSRNLHKIKLAQQYIQENRLIRAI